MHISATRVIRWPGGTAGRSLSFTPLAAMVVAALTVLGSWGVRRALMSALPGGAAGGLGLAAVTAPEPPAGAPVPAMPRVVLLEPELAKGTDAAARSAENATKRTVRLLQRMGVPFGTLPDGDLTAAALKPYGVAVLPANRLTEGNVDSLRAFVAGGGRILAFYPQAPAGFFSLLGVASTGDRAPAVAGEFRWLSFVGTEAGAEAPAGFPQNIEQSSWRALSLTPARSTQVLGWWSNKGQRSPALTLNAAGMLMGHVITEGDARHKAEFLLAALGRLDGAVWGQAAQARTKAAASRLDETAGRWKKLRRQHSLSGRRAMVEQLTRETRAALADAAKTPSSDAHHGRLAYEKVGGIDRMLDRLHSAMTPAPKGELRGFWIHTYRPTDWDVVMAKAKAGGLNAAFVRIGRGGNVIYPSKYLPRDAWAEEAGGDELRNAIDAAHRHGLKFHAWRVNYHMGSASKEHQARMAAEDRLVRAPDGKQSMWANPGDPRNQELEYQVMRELVANYAIDGLHLDYIRYPEEPHYDFDFGPVSRREFEKAAGLSVGNWPADVMTGALKDRYEDWQRDNVSQLVRRVYKGVKATKSRVKVSAAVWRNYPRCRDTIRQDWPRWVRAGWLDFVVPMNYVMTAEDQDADVRKQLASTERSRPLMAGIGNWQLQSPMETLEQIVAARKAGAKGFVLFSYNDDQFPALLDVLSTGATRE